MTLHQKRRGRDRRGKGRSSWRDEFAATDSSGFSFESTQASGLHGAWTQGSLATRYQPSPQSTPRRTPRCRVLPDTLEKTSKSDGRLNTLENTSFSLHEQPTLLSYCSTRSHSLLVDKAHKKFGARYMGPRSQSAQGPREVSVECGPRRTVTGCAGNHDDSKGQGADPSWNPWCAEDWDTKGCRREWRPETPWKDVYSGVPPRPEPYSEEEHLQVNVR